MMPLRLEAPAKLNLSLRVTGRRHDGYHQLESLLVLAEMDAQKRTASTERWRPSLWST